jgi:hypothetical protein
VADTNIDGDAAPINVNVSANLARAINFEPRACSQVAAAGTAALPFVLIGVHSRFRNFLGEDPPDWLAPPAALR